MDGIPFTLYKFRSMRADAEAETGRVWASKDDPRVTPFAAPFANSALTRSRSSSTYSREKCSVGGPRPNAPKWFSRFSRRSRTTGTATACGPGITGWAQVNYKYGDTLEDVIRKLEYDLYYIKNMSLSLDSYIIFLTVKAMLLSRGSQ